MLLKLTLISTATVLSCSFELYKAQILVKSPDDPHWCNAIAYLCSPVPNPACAEFVRVMGEEAVTSKNALKKFMSISGSEVTLSELRTKKVW